MENMATKLKRHKRLIKAVIIWEWQEDDEVAIFINNYWDVIHKEGLDFWKLDVYLDENNCLLSHSTTKYCYGLRHILPSK